MDPSTTPVSPANLSRNSLYSNLEVASPPPEQASLEAAFPHPTDLDVGRRYSAAEIASSYLAPSTLEVASQPLNDGTQVAQEKETITDGGPYADNAELEAGGNTATFWDRTVCGMSVRVAIMVALVFVLLAVGGTVAGVLLGAKKDNNMAVNSASTSSTGVMTSATSSIVTINAVVLGSAPVSSTSVMSSAAMSTVTSNAVVLDSASVSSTSVMSSAATSIVASNAGTTGSTKTINIDVEPSTTIEIVVGTTIVSSGLMHTEFSGRFMPDVWYTLAVYDYGFKYFQGTWDAELGVGSTAATSGYDESDKLWQIRSIPRAWPNSTWSPDGSPGSFTQVYWIACQAYGPDARLALAEADWLSPNEKYRRSWFQPMRKDHHDIGQYWAFRPTDDSSHTGSRFKMYNIRSGLSLRVVFARNLEAPVLTPEALDEGDIRDEVTIVPRGAIDKRDGGFTWLIDYAL